MKVKFENFQVTTAQRASDRIDPDLMRELLAEAWPRGEGKTVRLVGVAVRFRDTEEAVVQLEMF